MLHPRSLIRGRSRLTWQRGFSLVEVTFAMAIMVFTVITILQILAVSLVTFNKSAGLTLEATMAQRVTTDIKQLPYAQLTTEYPAYPNTTGAASGTTGPFCGSSYFDAYGGLLATGDTPPSGGYVYHVLASLTSRSAFSDTFSIEICRNHLITTTLRASNQQIDRYTFVVSNIGQ